MAGRPGRKAKREADAPPPFGVDLLSEVGAQSVSASVSVPAAWAGAVEINDRAALAAWWRDHFAAAEAAAVERAAALVDAGPHPAVAYAVRVREYGALGIDRELAARLLGISEVELETFYEGEYRLGRAETISSAAKTLLRISTSLNDRVAVKGCIELLNRLGGEEWRAPAQKLEIDDARKRGRVIDSSALSYEDRQSLKAIMQRTVGVEPQGVAGAIDAEVSDGE